MKSHISVQDLTVHYGEQRALNHISIDIPDKKITAIIGPSGCGKTTLLKSFNRLLDLQEGVKVQGKVLVDGENIFDPKTEITHLRRRMGLLSQRPQVLPLTIYENVVYGLRIHGEKDKKKLDRAVERYLKEAHLFNEVKDRLHQAATRLSLGQQQRLCLARGLAVEPEVILGDEPTSALDPVSAEQIEQLFLTLKEKYTIVLVTHVLRQAKRLADYVLFLYFGNLIEYGPANELLNHPRYVKTQAYIEGRFIEEPSVDKIVDLKGMIPQALILEVDRLLKELEMGGVLKMTLGKNQPLLKITQTVAQQGHSILEVRRDEYGDWEVLTRKESTNFSI